MQSLQYAISSYLNIFKPRYYKLKIFRISKIQKVIYRDICELDFPLESHLDKNTLFHRIRWPSSLHSFHKGSLHKDLECKNVAH